MHNGVEIGYLHIGKVMMDEYKSEGTYDHYTIQEVGITVSFDMYNASEKVIKYINIALIPYNTVQDAVSDTTVIKYTGPISPNDKKKIMSDCLWYNSEIREVKLEKVIIQYMDDTEETIAGNEILNIYDKNSVYYAKRGKKEEEEQKRLEEEWRMREEERKREEERNKREEERKSSLKRAYIGLLVLTCLKKAKSDEEMKMHANQGLVLLLIEVFALIVVRLLGFWVYVSFILLVMAIGFSIKGIHDINNDNHKRMPLIGRIRIIK